MQFIITFQKILGFYLPKKLELDTKDHGYDWRKLPLHLKILELFHYLSIPDYKRELVRDLSEENAPHIKRD